MNKNYDATVSSQCTAVNKYTSTKTSTKLFWVHSKTLHIWKRRLHV